MQLRTYICIYVSLEILDLHGDKIGSIHANFKQFLSYLSGITKSYQNINLKISL